MGVSTDAYLYFGFDFSDREQNLECEWIDENNDIDEKMRQVCKVIDDSGMWTKEGDYAHPEGSSEREKAKKKLKNYYERKHKAIAKLTHDNLIGVDMHCHSEYPIWFVHINFHRAHRGYPTEITMQNMEVSKEDIQKLKEFCKKMKIPWQKPKWCLASYWG